MHFILGLLFKATLCWVRPFFAASQINVQRPFLLLAAFNKGHPRSSAPPTTAKPAEKSASSARPFRPPAPPAPRRKKAKNVERPLHSQEARSSYLITGRVDQLREGHQGREAPHQHLGHLDDRVHAGLVLKKGHVYKKARIMKTTRIFTARFRSLTQSRTDWRRRKRLCQIVGKGSTRLNGIWRRHSPFEGSSRFVRARPGQIARKRAGWAESRKRRSGLRRRNDKRKKDLEERKKEKPLKRHQRLARREPFWP